MLGEARRDAPLWLAGDVTGRGKVRASGSILREARGRLSARDPASPGGPWKPAYAPRGGKAASLQGAPSPEKRAGAERLCMQRQMVIGRKGGNRTGVQTPPPPNLGDAIALRGRNLQPDSHLLVAQIWAERKKPRSGKLISWLLTPSDLSGVLPCASLEPKAPLKMPQSGQEELSAADLCAFSEG